METNIRDIIRKAEDLSEKISNLQHEKTLPAIELDIILINIRTLYEDLKKLQSSSSWNVPPEPVSIEASPEVVTETEAPGKIFPEADSEDGEPKVDIPEAEIHQTEDQEGDLLETEVPEVEVPEAEVPEVEVPEAEVPEAKVPEAKVPETIVPAEEERALDHEEEVPESKGKAPGQTILADRYKGEKKFINESFSGNLGKNDISSKIQSKPIENISSALGINDRFKLINDLFKGDKDSFQNTITLLDDSPNFNEAFNYINTSFDWDMEEDSVQLLLDLVRRKFIVNQNE